MFGCASCRTGSPAFGRMHVRLDPLLAAACSCCRRRSSQRLLLGNADRQRFDIRHASRQEASRHQVPHWPLARRRSRIRQDQCPAPSPAGGRSDRRSRRRGRRVRRSHRDLATSAEVEGEVEEAERGVVEGSADDDERVRRGARDRMFPSEAYTESNQNDSPSTKDASLLTENPVAFNVGSAHKACSNTRVPRSEAANGIR